MNFFKRIHKYNCDTAINSIAILNFNKIMPELEKLHGGRIKVLFMKRLFIDYSVFYNVLEKKENE